METLKKAGRGFGLHFTAALVTGFLAGVYLRVAMKVVALFFPELARGFTFEGTAFLILAGINFTLAQSLLFTVAKAALPKTWWMKGLTYGCGVLLVYGVPLFLSNPDNDLFGPQAYIGVPLFAVLFVGASVLLDAVASGIETWVKAKPAGRTRLLYISCFLFVIPAAFVLGGIWYEMFTETIPSIRRVW